MTRPLDPRALRACPTHCTTLTHGMVSVIPISPSPPSLVQMGGDGMGRGLGRKQSRAGARRTPRAQGRSSAQGVVRLAVGEQAARSSVSLADAAQGRFSAVRLADAAQV